MNDEAVQADLPTGIGTVVAILLFVTFAYAYASGILFLWIVGAIALVSGLYVFSLFYRLVVALEAIARKL